MTSTSNRTEAYFNHEMLSRLFEAMGDEDVLVGGQALNYWCNFFDLLSDEPVMTKDADILASCASVAKMASEFNGNAIYPPRKGFGTALYGQVIIDVSKDTYLNIDVLRVVKGVDKDKVVKRAILVDDKYLVMNPIDLLISKITNFSKIPEKQNDDGKRQALLAIEVVNCFTRYLADHNQIEEAMLIATTVLKLGKSKMGMSVLESGINVFDGIYMDIPNDNFQLQWRPRAQEQIDSVLNKHQYDSPGWS